MTKEAKGVTVKMDVKEVTRKTLSKQTSEQLLGKLEKGTLMGTSKVVAIEILEKRGVGVGQFKDDEDGEPKAKTATKVKATEKPAAGNEVKKPAEKGEPKAKAEKKPREGGKSYEQSTENPKLKAGMMVKFIQRGTEETVKAKIISFYKWTSKKDVTKEAASMKHDGVKYVKNVADLDLA